MSPEKESWFGAWLLGIGEFYGKSISPTIVDFYWQALRYLSSEELQRAFIAYLRDPDKGAFMPKPADLLRVFQKEHQEQSEIAWKILKSAFSRLGRYHRPKFDDPLIQKTLDSIANWQELCDLTINELPHFSEKFKKQYEQFLQAESEMSEMKKISFNQEKLLEKKSENE
jgi:hypothetical protein